MKKVTSRSYAALIIAGLILLGTVLYLFRLVRDGGDWASFYANDSVYSNASLNVGEITDRNGTLLASAGDETLHFSDEGTVRAACLHVVGDLSGNIGTGALSVFRSKLVNYSFWTGTTTGGGSVKLSIDAELNVAAYQALNGQKGAVLVYNYQTGEILCMVSTPSYDPLYGFDEDDSRYEGAYINRCISASFTPGSVFKIITLAAAAETRSDLWNGTFYCDSKLVIGGQTVTCSRSHGTQTVEEAFANSCNCAFAQIANEVGGDVIAQYAAMYGLTESQDLNGIATKAGSIISGGSDKGNVAWEGIGQYKDLICPYSMLRLVGAIANGGVVVEPSILYGKSSGSTQLMNASTAQTVGSMMNYNVQYGYGASTFPGLSMHAKTGTAELGDGTSNTWFAGYITNADAPLAFVVVVEGVTGGSGLSTAAPIANTVLQKAVFG